MLVLNEYERISILGEAAGEITFSCITISNDGYWQALVSVKSDWFQCLVGFECSIERVLEFLESLRCVLDKGDGEAVFINEESNFDLDVKLNKLGQVHLKGNVCKSMADDSIVKYELASDHYALEGFCHALTACFSS